GGGSCGDLDGRLAHVDEVIEIVLRLYNSVRVLPGTARGVRGGLGAGVPASLNEEDDDADQHTDDRCPDVAAQPQDDLARVDADRLPDDAPGAVPDQVHGEELAPLQTQATADPEQEEDP